MSETSRAVPLLIFSLLAAGIALPGVAGAQPAAPVPAASSSSPGLENVVAAQSLLQAAREADEKGDRSLAIQRLEAILALHFPDDREARQLAGGACLLLAEMHRKTGDLPAAKAAALDGVKRCGEEPSPLKMENLRILAAIDADLGLTDESARREAEVDAMAEALKN